MKTGLLRLFLILNFSFLFFNSSRAQFAFIPDTNFRNFLMNNGYSACMNGDYLDTTCSAVVSATLIDCTYKNIYDLTGIEYFDSLQSLICRSNHLVSLTQFPPNL